LFTEHKILRLRVPNIARAAGGAVGDAERAAMRGHFVRGHFKQRASGLFWWSDFYRGDPTRPIDKTYDLGTR
jgi:hypothetical protein